MPNHILLTFQQHVSVVKESVCSTGMSAVHTCHQLKDFVLYEVKNITKEAPNCWAAQILYKATMGLLELNQLGDQLI